VKSLIKGIIRDEFNEVLEKYGDERKTEIIGRADEIQIEDLIKNEEVIVTITHKGYVKRMSLDTYKAQKRGGKGVKGAVKDEDFFTSIFTAETHDQLCSSQIEELFILLRFTISLRELGQVRAETLLILFATGKGYVKKTDLTEYDRINQNGKKAIKVQDGDTVVSVRVTDGSKDVLLCASSGKIIRFSEEDCRAMGRVSQGVKGISITTSEKVIGMEIIDDNVEILSVTENGYGKRTISKEYRKQTRGGKGIIAMKLTAKNGDIIQVKHVSEKEDLMIVTNKGQVIRTKISGISLLGRNTQGVRLINLKAGEKVVAVEKIAESEQEPEPAS
jgi:DNA gyrase subunit A